MYQLHNIYCNKSCSFSFLFFSSYVKVNQYKIYVRKADIVFIYGVLNAQD